MSENLRDHTLAWLESIGADGLIDQGGHIRLKEDFDKYELMSLGRVPAFRHADGTYHPEPEYRCPCESCTTPACNIKAGCLHYNVWLAHKEAK